MSKRCNSCDWSVQSLSELPFIICVLGGRFIPKGVGGNRRLSHIRGGPVVIDKPEVGVVLLWAVHQAAPPKKRLSARNLRTSAEIPDSA